MTIALKHVSEAPPAGQRDQPERPARARAGGAVGAQQGPGRPPGGRRPVHRGARAGARRRSSPASAGSGPRASRRVAGAAAARERGDRATDLPAAEPRPSVAGGTPARAGRRGAPGPSRPTPSIGAAVVAVVALLVALLLAGGGVAAYLADPPDEGDRAERGASTSSRRPGRCSRTPASTSALIYQTDTHPAGVVIGQIPLGGAKVEQGLDRDADRLAGPGDGTVPAVAGTPAGRRPRKRSAGRAEGRADRPAVLDRRRRRQVIEHLAGRGARRRRSAPRS